MSYYYCTICGNIVECEDEKSLTLSCCNKKMEKLDEFVDEHEYAEKHLPVYVINDNVIHIKVGETLHPFEEKHHIKFIELITDKGKYIRILKHDERPECSFCIDHNEKPLSIRIFCNIHGLWRRYIAE